MKEYPVIPNIKISKRLEAVLGQLETLTIFDKNYEREIPSKPVKSDLR